jgi:hypothetical protein
MLGAAVEFEGAFHADSESVDIGEYFLERVETLLADSGAELE